MAEIGRLRRALAPAPFLCAGLNAAAAVLLATVLAPGTELGGGLAERAAYVDAHAAAWRAGWSVWMTASISLVAFYLWWALRLRRRNLALGLWLIAVMGFACDITAELLMAVWVPGHLVTFAATASALTGVGANGLYTIAGAGLTVLTRPRGPFALWAWCTWAAGAGLSIFTLAGDFHLAAVSAAVLFTLFCPFAVLLPRHLS